MMLQQRITADPATDDGGGEAVGTAPALCPVLLAAMIAEVSEASSDGEARGFFNAVGARLAALLPLNGIDAVDELVGRMNELWEALGGGRVGLELDEQGIDIRHRGLPAAPDGRDGQLWRTAAAHVLEGAYESWFRSLGSGSRLRTRLVHASDDLVHLRHGV